jgi:hypothetical protein
MNERDAFLYSQVAPMLAPDERVLYQTVMRRQPGLLLQILLLGGLLLYFLTTTYYVVLTNRRVILLKAGTSVWTGRPTMQIKGVEQWDVTQIRQVTTSGFANNRSMTFHFANGRSDTLRTSPWFETITGVRAFFEQVPALVASGQLMQFAAAPYQAPAMMGAAPPPA